MPRRTVRLFLVSLGISAGTSAAWAQSVRVTGVTTVQSVGVRPLVDDSVPIGEATGTGPYRQLADGRLVRCVEGETYCRFRRSGSAVRALPVVQDVEVAGWGLGEGVSVHAHLRGRESLGGSEFLWPRAADHFDALEAYLQLDRDRLRLRLGRQWTANGLGLYNFDGASLLVRRGTVNVEGLGGISLVEGLNESHTGGLLGSVDDLPPEDRAYLMGMRATARLGSRTALAGMYQRVLRTDRAGLYSERVALDGSTRALGITFDGAWAFDLVAGNVNEARLRASRELSRQWSATLEARRHRPFFESWTIWGAFSPVGFDEARATVGWHDRATRLSLDASGGWRRYDETNAGLESNPLRTDGWRAGTGIEWTPAGRWMAHADYDIDIGFGASRSDASAGVRFTPHERLSLGATLSALQNIYEFRVGTGRIVGLGVDAAWRVARDARVVVDGALYRNSLTNNATGTDWSQRRLAVRFEWTLGRDPGEDASRPLGSASR